MKLSIVFAWFDFYVGLFYSRKKKALYVFLIPCIGIMIRRSRKRVTITGALTGYTITGYLKKPAPPLKCELLKLLRSRFVWYKDAALAGPYTITKAIIHTTLLLPVCIIKMIVLFTPCLNLCTA